MAGRRQEWDQQPGESDADYARFLVYRNLGACRTLEASHRSWAQKGEKKGRASGAWGSTALEWRWSARADAWDVHNLITSGRKSVVRYLAFIDAVTARALESLANTDLRPGSWDSVLETLNALGSVIPPETILTLCSHPPDAGAGGEPEPDEPLPEQPGGLHAGSPPVDPDEEAGVHSQPAPLPPPQSAS